MLALEHVDDVQNERFVRNSAEGTLIDTGAAGNALAVVNTCLLFVAHGDRLDLAGCLALAVVVVYGTVGAHL